VQVFDIGYTKERGVGWLGVVGDTVPGRGAIDRFLDLYWDDL